MRNVQLNVLNVIVKLLLSLFYGLLCSSGSFSSGIFDKAKSKWDDEPREDDFKIRDDLSSWKPK